MNKLKCFFLGHVWTLDYQILESKDDTPFVCSVCGGRPNINLINRETGDVIVVRRRVPSLNLRRWWRIYILGWHSEIG